MLINTIKKIVSELQFSGFVTFTWSQRNTSAIVGEITLVKAGNNTTDLITYKHNEENRSRVKILQIHVFYMVTAKYFCNRLSIYCS